jgi:hypothetical protein
LLLSRGDAIRFRTRTRRLPPPRFDLGCSCYCRASAAAAEDDVIAHQDVLNRLAEESITLPEISIGRREAAKQFRKGQL